jgi:hypothetical protein
VYRAAGETGAPTIGYGRRTKTNFGKMKINFFKGYFNFFFWFLLGSPKLINVNRSPVSNISYLTGRKSYSIYTYVHGLPHSAALGSSAPIPAGP